MVEIARRILGLAQWHRRVAIVAGLWVIVLAATGLLINHANDLGLDRKSAPAIVQEALYGTGPSATVDCPAAAGVPCMRVFARLGLPAGSLLLTPDTAYLLDRQDAPVESLSAAVLDLARFDAVLHAGDWVYLRGPEGTVRADTGLLQWQRLGRDAPQPAESLAWLSASAAGEEISWERLLLDIHAARFLGPAAKWFTDLMALLILGLAVSGLWLWWLKRRVNGNGRER